MNSKVISFMLIFFLSILPVSLKSDDLQTELFIKRLYTNIFGQEGDSEGIEYWKEQIHNGKTATEVAKYFYRSPQIDTLNLSYESYINRAYITFLNREPDLGGYNFWLNSIQDREELKDYIFYKFALSNEFDILCKLYGITAYDQNDQVSAFIERFYNLILKREADDAGVNYWNDQLLSKEKTSLDIAKFFFLSNEFLEQSLSDQAFIKVMYSTLMDREADEGGLQYWLEQLETTITRENMIDIFINTSEFKEVENQYLKEKEPLETFYLQFDDTFLQASKKYFVVKCSPSDSNRSYQEIGNIAFKDGWLDVNFTGIEEAPITFSTAGNQLIANSNDEQLTMTFEINNIKNLFAEITVTSEVNGYGEIDTNYEWWFNNKDAAEIFLNQKQQAYQQNQICTW